MKKYITLLTFILFLFPLSAKMYLDVTFDEDLKPIEQDNLYFFDMSLLKNVADIENCSDGKIYTYYQNGKGKWVKLYPVKPGNKLEIEKSDFLKLEYLCIQYVGKSDKKWGFHVMGNSRRQLIQFGEFDGTTVTDDSELISEETTYEEKSINTEYELAPLFTKEIDNFDDTTIIKHKYFRMKNDLCDLNPELHESESLSVYVNSKEEFDFLISYSGDDWIFLYSVSLFDEVSGKKMKLNFNAQPLREVLGSGYVVEIGIASISTDEEIKQLKEMLELKPKLVFQGEKCSNKFFDIPEDMIRAIKQTLNYKDYSDNTVVTYVKH